MTFASVPLREGRCRPARVRPIRPRPARPSAAGLALGLALTLCALSLPATAEVHRLEDAVTGWWWYSNISAAEVAQVIADNDARMIDIEIFSSDPLRFTAAFVRNTGVYDSGWWWYYGLSFDQIAGFLDQNDARLIDIERYVDENSGDILWAVLMVPNTGAQQKPWWWYVGVSPDELADYLARNDGRLVDIESYDTAAGRRYAAIMIENSGDDATPWLWYYNVEQATLDAAIDDGFRILEFEVRGTGADRRFDAVLIPVTFHQPKTWWWYFGVEFADIGPLAAQAAVRITDIDTYLVGGERRYNVVMLSNANDLTVEMGELLDWGRDGDTGAYLREIDGSTLAYLNPDFVFEPASTIKAVHHLHTLRDVMMGGASLGDPITYSENYSGSCPIGGQPLVTRSLQEVLRRMMVNSDNAATKAISDIYGFPAITSTAQDVAGMASTGVYHTLGCGTEALANPNELSLHDIGLLYEGVETLTLLDEPRRQFFYDLMQNQGTPAPWWFTTDLQATVEEEAAALGIPEFADSFWANTRTAWKPGGYTLIIDGDARDFVSVGGIVSLPSCAGWPDLRYRHYVFGVFVHDAQADDDAFQRLRDAAKELLRDAVAEALITCPTGVQDPLPAVAGVMLEPNFPNPFNPSTTLLFSLEQAGEVRLAIYDAAGREVRELLAGTHDAGRHQVVWDGRDRGGRLAAAGVYLARLEAAGRVETRKLALIK